VGRLASQEKYLSQTGWGRKGREGGLPRRQRGGGRSGRKKGEIRKSTFSNSLSAIRSEGISGGEKKGVMDSMKKKGVNQEKRKKDRLSKPLSHSCLLRRNKRDGGYDEFATKGKKKR